MLFALQVVAVFLFADSTRVQVAQEVQPKPQVTITVARGLRSLTQRLDRSSALWWGSVARQASTLGDTPLRPDTLQVHTRVFGFLNTTVSCGAGGCRAVLFEAAANFAYLRPGPLPLAQVAILGRAIHAAGGWAQPGDPSWPYFWRQP